MIVFFHLAKISCDIADILNTNVRISVTDADSKEYFLVSPSSGILRFLTADKISTAETSIFEILSDDPVPETEDKGPGQEPDMDTPVPETLPIGDIPMNETAGMESDEESSGAEQSAEDRKRQEQVSRILKAGANHVLNLDDLKMTFKCNDRYVTISKGTFGGKCSGKGRICVDDKTPKAGEMLGGEKIASLEDKPEENINQTGNSDPEAQEKVNDQSLNENEKDTAVQSAQESGDGEDPTNDKNISKKDSPNDDLNAAEGNDEVKNENTSKSQTPLTESPEYLKNNSIRGKSPEETTKPTDISGNVKNDAEQNDSVPSKQNTPNSSDDLSNKSGNAPEKADQNDSVSSKQNTPNSFDDLSNKSGNALEKADQNDSVSSEQNTRNPSDGISKNSGNAPEKADNIDSIPSKHDTPNPSDDISKNSGNAPENQDRPQQNRRAGRKNRRQNRRNRSKGQQDLIESGGIEKRVFNLNSDKNASKSWLAYILDADPFRSQLWTGIRNRFMSLRKNFAIRPKNSNSVSPENTSSGTPQTSESMAQNPDKKDQIDSKQQQFNDPNAQEKEKPKTYKIKHLEQYVSKKTTDPGVILVNNPNSENTDFEIEEQETGLFVFKSNGKCLIMTKQTASGERFLHYSDCGTRNSWFRIQK